MFHVVYISVGVGLLGLCAYATATGLQARGAHHHPAAAAPMTLRSLFEEPDFHAACTDAVLQADGSWDQRSTRVAVEKIARRRAAEPEAQLDARPLTPERREALLHVVRHSMDPEVQAFGRTVGRIAARSADKEDAVRKLQQVATGEQIRAVRDVLFPVASAQHRQTFTLRPEKMQLLRHFEQWHARPSGADFESRILQSDSVEGATASPTAAPTAPPTLGQAGDSGVPAPAPTEPAAPTFAPTLMTVATTTATTTTTTKALPAWRKWWNKATEHNLEEALDILAALVLEADNVLSNLDMVGGTFDSNGRLDKGIPYWSKSLLGGASSLLGISKCFVEADDDAMGQDTGAFSQGNFMLCSMQYAESVADFLSAVDDVMGMSGSSSGFFGRAAETTTTAAASYWAYSR